MPNDIVSRSMQGIITATTDTPIALQDEVTLNIDWQGVSAYLSTEIFKYVATSSDTNVKAWGRKVAQELHSKFPNAL